MTNSEYLFYLIKSLSNNEKRFFSLSSQFYDGEKVYSAVFNVIDKMEQYDDEPLLKLMNGNKQKLAATKNYLYNQILKSLRTHNEKESIEAQLYNLILDVENLKAKGLFHPALKRLKKARKIATDYEKSTFLMEIINVETDIRKEIINKKIQEEFGELFGQANEALDTYSEFIKLKELTRKLYNFFIIGKKQELPEAWVREIEDLPASANSLSSFYAKKYYHSAWGYYCGLTGDIKVQKEHFGLRVGLWQQHPKMIRNRYQEYRLDLSNYVICCVNIGDFEEVPNLIDKIKKIPTKSKYEEASNFQNAAFIELIYYLKIGNLRKAITLENYIEKNIILYRGLINKSREIIFYHHMMIAFFGWGDYKKASKWLNKILYDHKSEPGQAAKRFAWIMEVIIHYQAENNEVVEWFYKKADFPLNKDEPHQFSVIALGHLKKITKAPITERKALFKKFRKELNEYKKDNRHFGMEVLSIWIESNITNKSFEEVMKERMS